MKKVKFLFVALAAMSLAFASCSSDEPKKTDPVVTPPDATLEEAPAITAPVAGKVTIAVRVPSGTCQGIVAIGAGSPDFATAWTLTSVVPFVKVSGTETWYSVTLTYAADMAVKVIAVPQAGQSSLDWNTQWGMNTTDVTNVTFVKPSSTTADFTIENGGEVKLTTLSDQDVVYIDVAAWKSAPCVAKNAAGSVVFNVTVPETTPLTASVMLVGNFAVPNNWNLSATGLLMTNNGNRTYTITTDVPAACEYKYVVSADGTIWDWANNEVFTGNRSMPLDLQVNDVVTAWAADPVWIP